MYAWNKPLLCNLMKEVRAVTTNKHYFVERDEDKNYTVKTANAARASGVFGTQKEAIEFALELNPNDHPDVERVRHVEGSRPGEWRPHNK